MTKLPVNSKGNTEFSNDLDIMCFVPVVTDPLSKVWFGASTNLVTWRGASLSTIGF